MTEWPKHKFPLFYLVFSKNKCDLDSCNYGNVRPETASRTPPPLQKTLPLQEKAAAARRFHRLQRPVWKGLNFNAPLMFRSRSPVNQIPLRSRSDITFLW